MTQLPYGSQSSGEHPVGAGDARHFVASRSKREINVDCDAIS